ncbi:hypothetical protein BGZ94_006125 [Podila epigama]|nr:hypothetical protein BGZ94_006125 [Podila epigama]
MPPTNGDMDQAAKAAIAVGIALRNVSATNDRDLMFMTGENVVLLERLDSGECMGLCEGVVGRFNESDVDFSLSTPHAAHAAHAAVPPVPAKSRSRASSAASASSNDQKPVRYRKNSALEDASPAYSALARHSLTAVIAMDPHATTRPGPRKLVSEENLKVPAANPTRRQVLSFPSAPIPHDPSSAPAIPPRSSSRNPTNSSSTSATASPHSLPTTYIRQRKHFERHPNGSLSSASSMSSLADNTNASSSASTMTNSPEVKLNDPNIPTQSLNNFEQEQKEHHHHPHQQQHLHHEKDCQLQEQGCTHTNESATPSNNTQTPQANSPVSVTDTSKVTTSRPITPIQQVIEHSPQLPTPPSSSSDMSQVIPPKSKARRTQHRRQDENLLTTQPSPRLSPDIHQEGGHSLSTMLSGLRTKTNHVLKNTGFSMSPNAGLYSDHGSRDLDLNVVQMPTSFPVSSPAQSDNTHDGVAASVDASSDTAPVSASPSTSNITVSTHEGINPVHRQDDMPEPTSPTSLGSRFEKFRPWVKSENRQRSNSGPARHSDVSILQTLGESTVLQEQESWTDQHPQNGVTNDKPKLRQRRVSEATAGTTMSTGSAMSCPQQQSFGSPLSQIRSTDSSESNGNSNSNKQRSKINWFSKSNRNSVQAIEDPRKPHPLGHGIEGGITASHRQSIGIFSDYDEEDDEDSDADGDDGNETSAEGHKSTDNEEASTQFYINDYGFIYDLEDEMNQGLDLTGNGSAVQEWAKMSEAEKKRAIRKQYYNRENELKWIHITTRLHADHVRKSRKYKKLVRRGVPTSVRGRVWLFLAKADIYRKPGLFEELQKRGPLPIHEVIERDIHRCYPDHVHFRTGMGGTGQQDLQAILRAYAHYNPSVGYCQGMGRLVGMMLMQMPVEDAFWLLVATIEGYMHDYYTPTLRQLRIDAQVFSQLLKEQDPALSEHLGKNDVIPLMYMTQWFMTLFTMSLPWASVLRVWDVFYFDGVKALFRVGLAILYLCREHLLTKCPSSSELLAYILHIPLEILAPKPLLEAMLMIKLKKHNVQKLIAVTAVSMNQAEKDASRKSTRGTKTPSIVSTASSPVTNGGLSGAHQANNSQPRPEAPSSHGQRRYSVALTTQTATSKVSIAGTSTSSTIVAVSSTTAPLLEDDESSKDMKKVPRELLQQSFAPSSAKTAAAPTSSSVASSFSPLKGFRTRKRAGTVHN